MKARKLAGSWVNVTRVATAMPVSFLPPFDLRPEINEMSLQDDPRDPLAMFFEEVMAIGSVVVRREVW